ncbi:hypothetical protein H181DRAFT_00891 [Streptomyces sp. WMMB 714]|uniref:hypothetical protein n=1 Tax=Streptomyces sp. WMMB 714 TaxID=1286822 RepID=UPI000698B466|nr:hypothetical protein [Streptomyces sp. WMMB 714]SCK14005.1 hypothetical protein H181DRAFT_00891 [Streptomyces sp. WMMB 714]
MAPPPRRRRPSDPADLPDGPQQALLRADPALGRVHAPEEICAHLCRLGHAARHGRAGATHLTLAGWDARAELLGTPRTDSSAFSPATGHGAPDDEDAHAPTAAVRAWASLLEIRRVTAEDMALPAAWERQRPLHAVSLALQASGCPPAAIGGARRCLRSGYQVSEGPAPRSVRVDWRQRPGDDGPSPGEGLATCQDVLAARGWASDRYLGARHRPYLVSRPRDERAPLLGGAV